MEEVLKNNLWYSSFTDTADKISYCLFRFSSFYFCFNPRLNSMNLFCFFLSFFPFV